jgi:hypothetical protein
VVSRARAGISRPASLAPHLSPEQITETLATARAIGSGRYRAQVLASLAPHLPPEQIADALAIAREISNEEFRADALVSFAPHLPPEQIADALATARVIGHEGCRAYVLVSLAPHLPPEQIADVLADARVIGHAWHRAMDPLWSPGRSWLTLSRALNLSPAFVWIPRERVCARSSRRAKHTITIVAKTGGAHAPPPFAVPLAAIGLRSGRYKL